MFLQVQLLKHTTSEHALHPIVPKELHLRVKYFIFVLKKKSQKKFQQRIYNRFVNGQQRAPRDTSCFHFRESVEATTRHQSSTVSRELKGSLEQSSSHALADLIRHQFNQISIINRFTTFLTIVYPTRQVYIHKFDKYHCIYR